MNKYLEKIAANVSRMKKAIHTGVDIERIRQGQNKKRSKKKTSTRMFSRQSVRKD